MGAELSKNTDAVSSSGIRRVGSSGALDKKRASPEFPTSASTTSLATMGTSVDARGNSSFLGSAAGNGTRRNSTHTSSDSSSTGQSRPANKLLDNALFNSLRRSSNSRVGANSPDTAGSGGLVGSGEDHAVESLDLPIVEWEGYVTKRGHLVRNWKNRFFTLEGNHLSCTSCL